MKDIQNKIIISQKAFIIHIHWLHCYKGKLSEFFSEYVTFSVNISVCSLGGMTKYPDDVRPCSTLLEACLVLP
jgi:hypothetical protein